MLPETWEDLEGKAWQRNTLRLRYMRPRTGSAQTSNGTGTPEMEAVRRIQA